MISWSHVFNSLWVFDDPESRISYLNILFSLLFLAVAVQLWAPSERTKLRRFFSWSFWTSKTALVDYQLFILNILIKTLVLAPWLLSTFTVTSIMLKVLYKIAEPERLNWSAPYPLMAYTLGSFILNDFFRFFHHYLMHRYHWLWRFHRIHHSAEELNFVTVFRTHPIEMVMATIRNALSAGISTALFIYFFQRPIGGLDILGINAIGFLFNLLGANLRHSPFYIGFGPLEYIFISPAQHQIHHSIDRLDQKKNLGVSLSVWDFLFGSHVLSSDRCIDKIGINQSPAQNLKAQLLSPWSREN